MYSAGLILIIKVWKVEPEAICWKVYIKRNIKKVMLVRGGGAGRWGGGTGGGRGEARWGSRERGWVNSTHKKYTPAKHLHCTGSPITVLDLTDLPGVIY